MRVLTFSVALVVSAVASVLGQEGQSPQQLFEAGQADQALRTIAEQREQGAAGPDDAYLAGQILIRMNQIDNAKREFESLTALEDEAWRLIGESGSAFADNDSQRAVDAATQAVAVAPDRFAAHYQLGMARVLRGDSSEAAAAFERAVEINPTFAYAYYYAGVAFSKIGRSDRTSYYYDRFLKLAPNAPERSSVLSIMRTLRR